MTQTRKIDIKATNQERSVLEHLKAEIDRGIAFMNGGQYDRSILIFQQLVSTADVSSAGFDILQHNLLTAYKCRIEQLLNCEDVTPVNRYLPEMLKLSLKGELSTDAEFRRGFADTFKEVGMAFYEKRQHEAALVCLRKAIAIEPCPSYYVDLTNVLAFTKKRAQLEDYTRDYSKSALGRHIFIACSPKSGSTFLKNVLVSLTGYRDLFAVFASLQNEQELDLPQLVKFGNVNTVTQQHVRATEANIQLMQAFQIRPIVLVRNIYDSVVSLLDFYRQGYTFSTFFDRTDFLTFDEEQQIDLLIDYAVPWFFQFVASWHRADKDDRLEVQWLTYEDLLRDKPAAVNRVLSYYGLSVPPTGVQKKIAEVEGQKDKNRMNIGIVGRGDWILTSSQKSKIAGFARHFPNVDFSRLGL